MISLLRRLFPRPVLRPVRVRAMAFALVALVGASAVHAQPAQTITFEEAVRIALNQNISLQQAENAVELQERMVFQRRMDFLPNLSFSSGGSRGSGFAQVEGGQNVPITNQSYSGSISTQVNLFNGFADVARLDQARHQRDASEYSYERTRQDVVFDVINNFLLYVDARQQIEILEENLESQRQQLEQIEQFVNVGARPISDLYQQQAQAASAELSLLNAERTLQINRMRLIQVLQLDPFGNYEFAAPEIADVVLVPQTYDLDLLLETAFERRTDLRAQEGTIRAQEESIRIARSAYYPTVNMSANYRTNFSPDDRLGRGFLDQLDGNRGNSIGFSISMPIFNRFTRSTNVQQQEVQHRNAVLNLQNLRQQVALQVRQAYLDYLTTEKQVEVSEAQLRAATQALEAAEERYNVGAGTLVELTQARAAYVQAAGVRARARYDYLFQGKLVDYYVGMLDPAQPLLDN